MIVDQRNHMLLQDRNHYSSEPHMNSFQMAAARQNQHLNEESMTQQSSTMSLADALKQAKATADRLERGID